MNAFPSIKQALLIFFVVGLGAYFNILFNDFIFDDKEQIIKPFIIHDLKYIPLQLITSVHTNSTDLAFSYYYKPLMYVCFTIFYWIGQENPLPFHLFQVIIHVLNSWLIFYLFKKIFLKKIALFLGIIFLIHPVNQGTVAYISSLQDVLFLFFGLIAVINAFEQRKFSIKSHILISIFLFLSLLSKETGVLFVIITSIVVFMNKSKNFTKYLSSVFIIGVLYLTLRIISSNYFFLYKNDFSLNSFTFSEKITNIPYIVYFYLKELFLPINNILPLHTLLIKNVNFLEIFINMLIIFLFVVLIFFLGKEIKKKEEKQFKYYLLFVAWFALGMLFHLQIISLDTAVANRWLYFPLVGFLGVIGFAINNAIKTFPILKKVAPIIAVVIILYFSLQVVTMNSYWKNQAILNSHLENSWH